MDEMQVSGAKEESAGLYMGTILSLSSVFGKPNAITSSYLKLA